MKSRTTKLVLLLVIFALLIAFFAFDLGQYLTLDYLKASKRRSTIIISRTVFRPC